MHRTEGENNSSNLFVDGPPGTRVEKNWLNAIQEEIANIIETSGLTLKTASTETQDQLLTALQSLFTSTTVNIVTYTANDTYSKSADLKYIEVKVFGAGGGGGGVDGQGAGTFGAGGGGGSGGISKKVITASSLSASETITIGAGGAGGIASATGANGGTTSFGSHCQSTGGDGGQGETNATTPGVKTGSKGGLASGGDINDDGFVGHCGVASDEASGRLRGGAGGGAGGGETGVPSANGNDATSPGGGGGGASSFTTATDYNGGAGEDGIIIIKEFF